MHHANSFLTLTYRDDSLPVDKSLHVKHWQDFAKRLRKTHPFRFFHCGEYSASWRPHYHAACFGQDFIEDREFYRETESGHQIHTSATLDKAWGHGQCFIGELTFESAAYVARYVMKKMNGDRKWDHYGYTVDTKTGELLGTVLKPEYTTMSRSPGLGKTWIDKFMSDVYPSDFVIINGHAARPPKFYDTQYAKTDSAGWRKILKKRMLQGDKYADDQTPERLAVREIVALAKGQFKTLKRR